MVRCGSTVGKWCFSLAYSIIVLFSTVVSLVYIINPYYCPHSGHPEPCWLHDNVVSWRTRCSVPSTHTMNRTANPCDRWQAVAIHGVVPHKPLTPFFNLVGQFCAIYPSLQHLKQLCCLPALAPVEAIFLKMYNLPTAIASKVGLTASIF